jgi:peptidoglycan L-alanyl-D-glutamate endopeptidase CwlK
MLICKKCGHYYDPYTGYWVGNYIIENPKHRDGFCKMCVMVPEQPEGIAFSRDIKHAHPYLQDRWAKLQESYHNDTGRDIFLTCTWRSVENQQKLYAQGRTAPGPIVTKIDGIERKSEHNFYPSRAIDVCVDKNPDPVKVSAEWNEEAYIPLIGICERLGLVSGGSWKWKDFPHVEVPGTQA